MCWLVMGSLPSLFPESDLIISTCSSLRPQGQQLQQHRDINKARCYKGSWRPTSRDLADKVKASNKKRKGGRNVCQGLLKRNKLETCYACIWDTAVRKGGRAYGGSSGGSQSTQETGPSGCVCARICVCVDTAAHPSCTGWQKRATANHQDCFIQENYSHQVAIVTSQQSSVCRRTDISKVPTGESGEMQQEPSRYH